MKRCGTIIVIVFFLLSIPALVLGESPYEAFTWGKNLSTDKKRVVIYHGENFKDKRALVNLVDDSEGDVEIDAGPKSVFSLKGRFKIDTSKSLDEAVVEFFDRHRDAFGLKNPKDELKLTRKSGTLRFQQTYNGIPIWGAEVLVHVNKNRELDDISSNHIPTPDIDTTPLITKEEAIEIALADRNLKKAMRPVAMLFIYKNTLAYNVHFLYEGLWTYWINAKTGKIISAGNA